MTELFRRRDVRAASPPPAPAAPGEVVLPWAGEPQAPAGDEPDDDLDLHEGWERPRIGTLTVLLAVGVLAVAAFIGGVLVQKNHDAGLASASGTRARAAGAFPAGGFPAGGFGAGTGAGAGAGAGGPTAAAAAPPVVVGTVAAVKGSDLTVKNFAGATVVVHVPAGTPVTLPGLIPLAPGMTVSVTGTKAADGSVTATAVVARKPG
jgi:hypothetical protein